MPPAPGHMKDRGRPRNLRNSTAAIAQLAARRSHNPKVVSSILTRRNVMVEARRQSMGLARGRVDRQTSDSLPEWSKGVDSSSTRAICVGSNPTAVIHARQLEALRRHTEEV